MSIPCDAWRPNLSHSRALGLSLAAWLCCGAALGCSDESYRLGGSTLAEATATATPRFRSCKDGAELESIDRMEDRDGTIELQAQRGGVWFSFNDKTDGQQSPAADDEVFAMSELSPPRAGSHYAARSHGGGFQKWGAGIGFELYNQKAYDLSSYAGIVFWARRAADAAATLRFALTDAATAPRGGQCHDYADYSSCSDYFGSDLSLTTDFRRYSFSWSDLTQEGWGDPQPASVDTHHVYGVRFQAGPRVDFDFWIDDIALLCRPE